MKKKAKKAKKSVSKPTSKKNSPRVNTIGYTPIKDNILVRPLSPEELDNMVTSFGIIIPETAKKKPDQGVVVAIGPGRFNENGVRVPVDVQVGDHVYFKKPWDDPLTLQGVDYYVVTESDITLIKN